MLYPIFALKFSSGIEFGKFDPLLPKTVRQILKTDPLQFLKCTRKSDNHMQWVASPVGSHDPRYRPTRLQRRGQAVDVAVIRTT